MKATMRRQEHIRSLKAGVPGGLALYPMSRFYRKGQGEGMAAAHASSGAAELRSGKTIATSDLASIRSRSGSAGADWLAVDVHLDRRSDQRLDLREDGLLIANEHEHAVA